MIYGDVLYSKILSDFSHSLWIMGTDIHLREYYTQILFTVSWKQAGILYVAKVSEEIAVTG